MTAALITLFAGTILILLAAAVTASTQRQRLGTRKSKLLASGAIILLLAQAMYPLRPLLLARIQDALDASLILPALQAALQLAGLALIIAAVLTTSPASTTSNGQQEPTQQQAQ